MLYWLHQWTRRLRECVALYLANLRSYFHAFINFQIIKIYRTVIIITSLLWFRYYYTLMFANMVLLDVKITQIELRNLIQKVLLIIQLIELSCRCTRHLVTICVLCHLASGQIFAKSTPLSCDPNSPFICRPQINWFTGRGRLSPDRLFCTLREKS